LDEQLKGIIEQANLLIVVQVDPSEKDHLVGDDLILQLQLRNRIKIR
jgi:hypothetical protein